MQKERLKKKERLIRKIRQSPFEKLHKELELAGLDTYSKTKNVVRKS